jgi:hypothetical protein
LSQKRASKTNPNLIPVKRENAQIRHRIGSRLEIEQRSKNTQGSASRFSQIMALPEYFRSDTPGSARSCDIYPNRLSL